MQLKTKILFWTLAAVGVLLFLFVFSSILLPFVAGMALAYLVDPVADKLERLGLSRLLATLVIVLLFLVVVAVALLLILPLLTNQLAALITSLPDLFNWLQSFIVERAGPRIASALHISQEDLRSSVGGMINEATTFMTGLAKSLLSGGQAIMSVLSFLVLMPVIAFYMLLDWDRMVAKIDGLLPRDYAPTIRMLAREMDAGVSNFVRGQVSVCLLLGIYYATALVLVGLKFGFLIGIGIGLISFIPYVGATIGAVVSVGVAIVQFWPDWTMIAAVVGIFAVGQFIEGNVLQPKLIGNSVGLHPVWLMFALFAFGSLFGFVGMLIAVPASTVVAVLIRFSLGQYLESPLYLGQPPSGPMQSLRAGKTEAEDIP
ncbi:Transport of quorum-sensing signal protein [Hartmannibacter diazotrophicus]|uniref:Transport of quorum-sensing signal protein n=1 Tax=Hartmannibacter diazotrophicus TaxID=1482074 RepID=A0A2C9D817_9HYPH|nr:AI-2E family transporter [Hartmannibacter diazotrophicus]SON56320.1 Transport of quorum-sensing signal protein [Hartmannibacter diazotrophicus]